MENPIKRILEEALALFGPNGENWTKGSYAKNRHGLRVNVDSTTACKFCAMGAIMRVNPKPFGHLSDASAQLQKALTKLHKRTDNFLIEYNDHKTTTFNDIQKVYQTAIEML
jgi:hypothetical protein